MDPGAGQVDVYPQEITRALLNLISNGFYAATKRKAQVDSDGYEPALTVATKNLGDRVEITIRDNGSGIPPEVKEKMFAPFLRRSRRVRVPGSGSRSVTISSSSNMPDLSRRNRSQASSPNSKLSCRASRHISQIGGPIVNLLVLVVDDELDVEVLIHAQGTDRMT